MEIWLDTIDLEAVADGARTGLVSGVTTNPSILGKAKDVAGTLKRLLDLQPGPVAVQVTSSSVDRIIEEALAIHEFSNRLIVKIPINHNGLIAIEQLKKKSIPILGTGILFPTQALTAACQNVAYIAPYFSYMPENGLKTIVDLIKATQSTTKILAASLKELDHIVYCALLGIEAITIKAPLYHQWVANQALVESFSQKFLADWVETHGNLSIKEVLK